MSTVRAVAARPSPVTAWSQWERDAAGHGGAQVWRPDGYTTEEARYGGRSPAVAGAGVSERQHRPRTGLGTKDPASPLDGPLRLWWQAAGAGLGLSFDTRL